MKAPNHGCRVRVTCTDEGDELEFEGRLALDPHRAWHVPEETGLLLVMRGGDLLPVYRSDRIEIIP